MSAPPTRFRATNHQQNFAAEFTAEGVSIASPDASASPLRLMLARYGRLNHSLAADMGGWESRGNRIERRSQTRDMPVTEWYVNGPLGLEQGFTIDAAPRGLGQLTVALTVGQGWSVQAREPGRSVTFVEQRSNATLAYGELYAFDADRRPLDARLTPTSEGVSIQVDAGDARYPITIDPFLQQQPLTVAGLAADDRFGFSVAMDRDGVSAVVGVPGRDLQLGGVLSFADNGTAFVFVRDGQSWHMQAQLSPSGLGVFRGEVGRQFGHAVAIAGDTAVIAAPFEDVGDRTDAGAVYVFQRNGVTWSQVDRLTGGASATGNFGAVVAMDSPFRDRGVMAIVSNGVNAGGSGASQVILHIYTRPATTWTFAQALSLGSFISSVAVSGRTIVAGLFLAPPAGAVVVLSDNSDSASFQSLGTRELRPPDGVASDLFGRRVAISQDYLLVGAPGHGSGGAGYIFRGSGTNWTFEEKLEGTTPGAEAGNSAAIASGALGRAAVLGGVRDVFVFRQRNSVWAHDQTLHFGGGFPRVAAGVDFSSAASLLLVSAPDVAGTGAAVLYGDVPAAPTPPPPPTPPAPAGLLPPTLGPAIVTGSTVQLNWSAASGAVSYRLRAGTTPGGSNAFDGHVGAVTTLTAASVPNGSYFVRVHSVGSGGESGPSNEVRVDVGSTSGCSSPSGPTNLRATVNGALVTLLWNAAPGAVSYILEAGSAAGLSNLATVDVGLGTTFMANAPPGTYFVRVRMRNACGATAVSNEIIIHVG